MSLNVFFTTFSTMSLFTSSVLGAILAGLRVAHALFCCEWPSGTLRATRRSPQYRSSVPGGYPPSTRAQW
eukprot:5666656-Heterocapsa_arctica.AAC.1